MSSGDTPRDLDWALANLGVAKVLDDTAYRGLLAVQVRILRLAGWKFSDIGTEFGIEPYIARRLYTEVGHEPVPADREPARYDRARLITEYLSGLTPRELRALHRVPLPTIFADLGIDLWSRRITAGVSAVDKDRPEVAARIVDPKMQRPLAILVKQDHHAGWPMARLSTEYELTDTTIRRLITAVDVELLRRARDGEPSYAIATEFGVTRDTIAAWMPTARANAEAVAAADQSEGDKPPPADFKVTAAVVAQYRQALGQAIRARRVKRHIKPAQAARQIGVSPSGMANHERGAREISPEALLRYAVFYRVSPAVLVGEAFDAIAASSMRNVVTVDLAALAVTTRRDLVGLREWARLRLQDAPHTKTIRVDITVIDQLSALCGGLSRDNLIAALDEIANSERDTSG